MPIQCNLEDSNPKHEVCIQGCAMIVKFYTLDIHTLLTHICGFSYLEDSILC